MAHVNLPDKPHGALRRFAWLYSRRRFGEVVDPVRAASHHQGVLIATGALETAVQAGWKRLDPHLRWLAVQPSSGEIGCSWCTDFGYYEGMQQGVDPAKVRNVPRWRDYDGYDDRERAVLEYAEAATATPAVISEDLVARLHRYFDDAELVELAGWVALENLRSRFNAGLGLRSQGFSDKCDVPALVA